MTQQPLPSGFLLRERYLIMRLLHEKGRSALYEARDTSHPGFMALRGVKEYHHTSDEYVPRYRLIMNLDHSSIPTSHDYFQQGGATYYVSDFVHGRDLERILTNAQDKLPVAAVHQWALELANVVHYLHTHPEGPIIHRDIKPSNLMIDQRLRLQVVDFDIAGVFADGQTDDPLGTDGYAAPEQYQGKVTPQIDVFSIGATLHHLLTGRDPRVDTPFSQIGVSVRLFNDAVSPAFDDVIQRALAYAPTERYRSAMALRDALASIDPLAS